MVKDKRAGDQRIITYKERRFIPVVKDINIMKKVTVTAGDRLDNIASQTIGDPEQFWKICDINGAIHPLEITSVPGKVITIGIPTVTS